MLLDRREISTRKKSWAKLIAKAVDRLGITPNQISVAGIGCAGASLYFYHSAGIEKRPELLLGAALFIQLRLLCNMLDGLVAIELNKKSALGDLFNEIPDRLEDILIFVGAGLVFSQFAWLGWLTSLLALLTAYIRLLGKAIGTRSYYVGPQAKQHRMFMLTVGTLLQAWWGLDRQILVLFLGVIALGTFYTSFRRLTLITRDLKRIL